MMIWTTRDCDDVSVLAVTFSEAFFQPVSSSSRLRSSLASCGGLLGGDPADIIQCGPQGKIQKGPFLNPYRRGG